MSDLVFARLAGVDVALVPIANHDARAIVDAEDAPLIAGRPWRYQPNGYAATTVRRADGDSSLYMHQLILPVDPPLTVDHHDGYGLNNRRSNLRAATRAEQQHNRGIPRTNQSGYKGVSWHRHSARWRATILILGRHRHLGLFDDPIDAARAYDEAALGAWGDFARTNFAEATR